MADGRRGRARSETAWRAILAATRDELAERGYDRLSIDRIAAAAGVGKQTIYRWYPAKSSLVAECILEGYVFSPGITMPDTGEVRRDISDWLLHAFADTTQVHSASLIRAVVAASAEDAEVARQFQQRVTAITHDTLTSRLRTAEEAGQVERGLPLGTAAETIIGALLHRILTRNELTSKFIDEVLDVVFAGIQPPVPGATP